MKPYYVTRFEHVELGPDLWQLTRPLGFVASRGELVAVRALRKWNGATIPKWIRWMYPPNGSYLKQSCLHDEILDESDQFDEDRKYHVFDMKHKAVQEFARQMDGLSNHAFDRMKEELWEYSYRIESARAHRIMYEAMAAKPNPTPPQRRTIIWLAVRVGGPRWSMEVENG